MKEIKASLLKLVEKHISLFWNIVIGVGVAFSIYNSSFSISDKLVTSKEFQKLDKDVLRIEDSLKKNIEKEDKRLESEIQRINSELSKKIESDTKQISNKLRSIIENNRLTNERAILNVTLTSLELSYNNCERLLSKNPNDKDVKELLSEIRKQKVDVIKELKSLN